LKEVEEKPCKEEEGRKTNGGLGGSEELKNEK